MCIISSIKKKISLYFLQITSVNLYKFYKLYNWPGDRPWFDLSKKRLTPTPAGLNKAEIWRSNPASIFNPHPGRGLPVIFLVLPRQESHFVKKNFTQPPTSANPDCNILTLN